MTVSRRLQIDELIPSSLCTRSTLGSSGASGVDSLALPSSLKDSYTRKLCVNFSVGVPSTLFSLLHFPMCPVGGGPSLIPFHELVGDIVAY